MLLPPIKQLVAEVREQGPGVLDLYAPAIDELADTAAIAAYLGVEPRSIYRERARQRAERPAWPDPEPIPGRSLLWRWRTIILYRADAPKPGRRSTKNSGRRAGTGA